MDNNQWLKLFNESFWPAWKAPPKRKAGVNRTPACKKWMNIKNKSQELFDVIMQSLEWFKQSDQWLKDDGEFIPMASTWINQERWTAFAEERGPAMGNDSSIPDNPHNSLTLREKYLKYRGIVTERSVK